MIALFPFAQKNTFFQSIYQDCICLFRNLNFKLCLCLNCGYFSLHLEDLTIPGITQVLKVPIYLFVSFNIFLIHLTGNSLEIWSVLCCYRKGPLVNNVLLEFIERLFQNKSYHRAWYTNIFFLICDVKTLPFQWGCLEFFQAKLLL